MIPGYLLFTGNMNYAPNAEAVQYFCPVDPASNSAAVVGRQVPRRGSDQVRRFSPWSSERVVIHGRVPDMRPYHHAAELVAWPVARGGGTRLKILEAAACGKAIVTTSAV